MLTLTTDAVTEIRHIMENPEVPDGCGVRIAADPSNGQLSLGLATEPADGDQVVAESGARVFLDPAAAMMLDDKALDAQADSTGQIQFNVASVK